MVKRFLTTIPMLAVAAGMGCSDTLSTGNGAMAITADFAESASGVSFDAARIRIIGPSNRTVNTTPGTEETIEGLAPGQYRVVVEGLEGSEVELFAQQNNVTVSADNVTNVNITFSSFTPSIDPLPAESPTLRVDVSYDPVPGAFGYVVEWDDNPGFATPTPIPIANTTAEVPGAEGETVFIRVRAATEFATFSPPSSVEVTQVVPVAATVAVSPANIDTLIGQGDTVQFSATPMDAKGDVFTGTLSWSSGDETVAQVDSEGRVIAQANGTADIIATADGVDGRGTFTSATMRPDSGLFFAYQNNATPTSLTWDGTNYWTINGGSQASGRIRQYDENGTVVDSIAVMFDGRGIYYRETDGQIYLKDFGLNWYRLELPAGTITPLETGIFLNNQTSPALTPDGKMIVEHLRDSVRFLDFDTKTETDLFEGISFGPSIGWEISVGTDGRFFYTWDETSTVFVYDYSGRLVTTFVLPVTTAGQTAGFSLSSANGMLWVTDTGSSTGIWHGFTLTQTAPGSPEPPPTQRTLGNGADASRSACSTLSTQRCR